MLLFSLRMSFSMYSYVVTWMSGTLAAGDWTSIRLLLPCSLLLVPLALSRARVLDVLSLGDYLAAGLGVSVDRQRLLLLGVATMLTATCVAIGGHIGFLGLAAPIWPGGWSVPTMACCFPRRHSAAQILLLVADSLGRHLLAPVEIPAGVLVGILGGIYFLYLLATTKG